MLLAGVVTMNLRIIRVTYIHPAQESIGRVISPGKVTIKTHEPPSKLRIWGLSGVSRARGSELRKELRHSRIEIKDQHGAAGLWCLFGCRKPQTLKPEPLTRCMVGSFFELLHLNLGCLGIWEFPQIRGTT